MTRKRLFKELSKSISIRVPKSKAVWMLPHIKGYIKHLEGGGMNWVKLMGKLIDMEGENVSLKKQIEELQILSQPRPLTEKDKKKILSEFYEDD